MATIKEFIEKSLFGKHYPSFKNYIFSESIRDLNKDNHIFYCYKKEIDDNFNKKIGKRQIPYLDRSLFKRGFIEDVDYDNNIISCKKKTKNDVDLYYSSHYFFYNPMYEKIDEMSCFLENVVEGIDKGTIKFTKKREITGIPNVPINKIANIVLPNRKNNILDNINNSHLTDVDNISEVNDDDFKTELEDN